MDFYNSIFKFFTDESRRLSSKAITSIIAIALIILIDNTLSFSYYYNTEKKIEQISNINEILRDTTLREYDKKKLLNLREQIINRITWKDQVWNFIVNSKFATKSDEDGELKYEVNRNNRVKRSYLLHFVSSSWLIIILIIAFPFVGIFNKKTPLGQAIGILLILEPTFLGIAWLLAKLFSLIPIILNNPTYNYFLNAFLCFAVFAVFAIIGKFQKKKNN